MFPESNPWILPDRLELSDLIFVRFAGNNQDRTGEISEDMVSKLNPVLQRPVFFMASAARMKRHNRGRQPGEKFQGTMSVFAGRIKFRREIRNWQTELFDWPRQLARCV